MSLFLRLIHRLAGDRRAVTSVEYALIAAVMGALVVNAVTTFGTKMDTAFTSIGTVMTTKASGM